MSHSSVPQLILLLCLLFLTGQVASYSYWVDKSCKDRPGFDEYLAEAFKMAERGSKRLADADDTDYHYVFKRIFDTDVNDQTEYKTEFYKKDTPKGLVYSTLNSPCVYLDLAY